MQVIKNIFFILQVIIIAGCETKVIYAKKLFYTEINSTNSTEKFISKKRNKLSKFDKLFIESGLINLNEVDSTISVNLKYADTNNFIHQKIYFGLKYAYLPKVVALRLCSAQTYIKKENPDLSLVVFDAARPLQCQKLMWDSLKWPNYKKYNYIAPPSYKSLHNYGCAVDVGLIDCKSNTLLDMGTTFDAFDSLSQPKLEYYFLKNKKLSQSAYNNRLILRRAMKQAKFYGIGSEWWHFNYCTMQQAIQQFTLVP